MSILNGTALNYLSIGVEIKRAILNGATLNYFKIRIGGTTIDEEATANILSLSITGQAASVSVNFANGDPLPIGGLYTDAASVELDGSHGPNGTPDPLVTTATAALIGSDEIRYPATTTLTDNLTSGGGIFAMQGTTNLNNLQDDTLTVLPGATVLLNGNQAFSSLTIYPGATVRMLQDGGAVLATDALNINDPDSSGNSGGVLDLADNDLIVHGGSDEAIAALIKAGYDAGNWDGELTATTPAVILNSTAAQDTTHTEALGYAQVGAAEAGQLNISSFDGQTVSDGDVVVRFTLYGDANLDGTVDSTDEAMLNNGYNNELTGWSNGDFTYGGSLDGSDFSLFNNIYVAAPTFLYVAAVTSTEIDLSWCDNAINGSMDIIYESTDGGATFQPIDEVNISNTSGNLYAAKGLTPGTAYQFYVTTEGTYEESGGSNTVSPGTSFVAPTLDVEGSSTVVENQPYELDLTASYPDGEPGAINHWAVNWNDGPAGTSDIINYTYPTDADRTKPLAVFHTFNSGIASPTVTVSAVDSANGPFTADAQPVTVTPIAPTGVSATASGSTINVNWTNASHISTGTTILLSTDDVAFFEVGGGAAGGSSTTISNLNRDTNYWVEALTEGANGESTTSTPSPVNTAYAQPSLVVIPSSVSPVQDAGYSLNLSATYADNTPQKDLISSWTINWGNGITQTYTGQAVDPSAPSYAAGTLSANVSIIATDSNNHSITSSQTIYFSPTGVNSGVLGGTYTAGGTSATLSWSGASNTIASEYIIQRISPGAEAGGWQTVADVPVSGYFSSDQYGLNYTYTANNLTPSPIGSDGGYLWRIGAKTSLATSDAPGAPGVSGYTPATPLNGIAAPDGQVSFTSPYSNIALTPTGGWTPSNVDSENDPVTFGSTQSLTFNINNLPAHMSYYVTFGPNVYGDSTSQDTFTLTGPHGINIVAGPTTMSLLNVEVPDDGTDTSASFTLAVHLGGTGRSWTIGEPGVYIAKGNVSSAPAGVANAGVVVGGETDVTVSFNSAYISDPAGTVLTVKNYDADVVQPTVTTLTLDSNGDAVLPVVGTGLGTGTIILQDAAGDQGLIVATVFAPSVSSTGNVTQGATYSTGNIPGFTFSIAYPSVTPVTINYSTTGSTLPSSLMGNLSGGSITIPAGQTSVFVPFTVPDEGKIAPQRTVAVTLSAADGGGQALMNVQNNDAPEITINGAVDNAAITLDPEGDNTQLTDIALIPGQVDETIYSWSLTWNPSEFLMWSNRQMGTAGVDDLASITYGSYGAHYDSLTGLESFTWLGSPPAEVYGQSLDGSANFDSTTVGFSVDVAKYGTDDVATQVTNAWNQASGTAQGVELFWNGGRLFTGINTQSLPTPTLNVGDGVAIQAVFVGPVDQSKPSQNVVWIIGGSPGTSYSTSTLADNQYPKPYVPNSSQYYVHFYWTTAGNKTVQDTWEANGETWITQVTFKVVKPPAMAMVHIYPPDWVGPDSAGSDPNGDGSVDIQYQVQKSSVSASSGNYFFVQTIKNYHLKAYGRSAVYVSDALDTRYPTSNIFPANGTVQSDTFWDDPSVQGISHEGLDFYLNATFVTTLMYQDTGDAIAVPLLAENWSFNIDESRGRLTFPWFPKGVTGLISWGASYLLPTDVYPTWSSVNS